MVKNAFTIGITLMAIEYVDILTGKNLSSIQVANIDLIYWSVYLSITRGWDGVQCVDGDDRYLSQLGVSLSKSTLKSGAISK